MSQRDSTFNNDGNPVNGIAQSHLNGRAGKSQTTAQKAALAVSEMNSQQTALVGQTGTGDRDAKVMDQSGGVWGVHAQPGPGGGVRQAYPIHQAAIIPGRNQYGGMTASFSRDPEQRAASTRIVFSDDGSPRNVDI